MSKKLANHPNSSIYPGNSKVQPLYTQKDETTKILIIKINQKKNEESKSIRWSGKYNLEPTPPISYPVNNAEYKKMYVTTKIDIL